MSDRNTALLLPGHVHGGEILEALHQVPGVTPADLSGEEAPRVGHGHRDGHDYTLVALRLFELGGLMLFDRLELPPDDEPEVHLGRALSGQHRRAVYLYFDEENGVGGHALFEDGVLKARDAIDGRWDEPVQRDLSEERVLRGLDPSDWIWPLLGDAVESGAKLVVGPGVRDDDAIEALIAAASPTPWEGPPGLPPVDPEPPRPRKRDRVRSGLKKLLRR